MAQGPSDDEDSLPTDEEIEFEIEIEELIANAPVIINDDPEEDRRLEEEIEEAIRHPTTSDKVN